MHRPSFDLRHLIALQVLLEERHVSRAAARLGLTQPAVSNSLAHLRAHFKDDFLVKKGTTLTLTPFAEQMQASVTELLINLQNIAQARPNFTPEAIDQTFRIVAGEAALHFMPRLARRISEIAPRATVFCVRPSREAYEDYRAGNIDLLILPEQVYIDEHPREAIMTDEWVCLAAADNPLVGDELTLETYRRLRHILPDPGRPGGPNFVRPGFTPDVAVYAPLSAAPLFLPGTCLVATVPLRVAKAYRGGLALREFPVPALMAPLVLAMEWHTQKSQDPANLWLRGVVRELVAEEA